MSARDVSDTLDEALEFTGMDQVHVKHKPRLLSDNGPSYVAAELKTYLDDRDMTHTRGRPYHPMTQGKIERWHRSMKKPGVTGALLPAGRLGTAHRQVRRILQPRVLP